MKIPPKVARGLAPYQVISVQGGIPSSDLLPWRAAPPTTNKAPGPAPAPSPPSTPAKKPE
jgi:hypothetical protein